MSRCVCVTPCSSTIAVSRQHDLPAIGNLETLQEIRERRRTMSNGYGLLRKLA